MRMQGIDRENVVHVERVAESISYMHVAAYGCAMEERRLEVRWLIAEQVNGKGGGLERTSRD
jgi:hypothetical protein